MVDDNFIEEQVERIDLLFESYLNSKMPENLRREISRILHQVAINEHSKVD